MPSENVELLRRAWDHFNRTGEVDLDLIAPEVEWRTQIESYRGHEGVRQWQGTFEEAFENGRIEPEEIIDAGGDRVLSVTSMRGRARLTGMDMELQFVALWTFRDGRIVKVDSFETKEEALRAAGGPAGPPG